MQTPLEQSQFARAGMFELRCIQCNTTFGYSHYHVIEPIFCATCTSPQPRWNMDMPPDRAAARLLRFALREENLFLAPAFVRSAMHAAAHRSAAPELDIDLSNLELDL